ncbi:MAG: hypothetical protein V4563_16830 [Pseudomonadota bacterium]
MNRNEAIDKFPLPAFAKWVEKDRTLPLHWAITCHQCKTVSHIAKDFKNGRCSGCGVQLDRPERDGWTRKTKKRAGFV